MSEAFICDGIRTPIGRYGGALAAVRTDDLAARPIAALMERNREADWRQVDDVFLGCTNQAGEDSRNLARMALLLAGLPDSVPGITINRLCASGAEAVAQAARAINTGAAEFCIAGGAESMSRAPFVMAKAEAPYSRRNEMFDSTMGARFINPALDAMYGTPSMPETAENLAAERQISRADQDAFALWSQEKTAAAQARSDLRAEIVSVEVPQKKGGPIKVDKDEHPRPETTAEALAALAAPFRKDGTVTAGNASGINDGAAALVIASEAAARRHGFEPRARIVGTAVAGVPPRIMGIGPLPAIAKLEARTAIGLDKLGVIELNEAFAAQCLAVTRELGLEDDDPRINPNGGAIALGHPLGMSGARLAIACTNEMQRGDHQYGLVTMCVGVGQGLAMLLERV